MTFPSRGRLSWGDVHPYTGRVRCARPVSLSGWACPLRYPLVGRVTLRVPGADNVIPPASHTKAKRAYIWGCRDQTIRAPRTFVNGCEIPPNVYGVLTACSDLR